MKFIAATCAILLALSAPAAAFSQKELNKLKFDIDRFTDFSAALAAAYGDCGENRVNELRSNVRSVMERFLAPVSVKNQVLGFDLELDRRGIGVVDCSQEKIEQYTEWKQEHLDKIEAELRKKGY